ncbi:MAG: hypothetical protein MI741_06785 [Rhodospirillales bacterium]|nr:hypothetical protein [Rhodospirillales bacterium]
MRRSSSSTPNIFVKDREGFRQRQAAALGRRLGEGLTAKKLAHAVGVHPDTVLNWCSGKVIMDGAAITAVDGFFSSRNDPDFLRQLFMPSISVEEVSSAQWADHCLWFTGEGTAHEARLGHAEFVREALQLAAPSADLEEYAIRNLGWVECVIRPNGLARLRYADQASDPAAVFRAREWIITEGHRLKTVELQIWQSGDWEVYESVTLSEAARMLDRAAVTAGFNRMSERDWNVERLPLDAVENGKMKSLVSSANQGTHVVEATAELGIMNTSSVLSVERNNVVSLWIGPTLGLPADELLNRNVLDREDRNYAALIHYHVLEATRTGPTFYRLDIEIMGRRRRYERIAVPQGSNLVVTATTLLEEGIAA